MAALLVDRQVEAISMLRSRGASGRQVLDTAEHSTAHDVKVQVG